MSGGETLEIRRGQRIVNVFEGPWEPSKVFALSGNSDPTWWYSSAYLELDSGKSYELTRGSLVPAPLPLEAKRAPEMDGALPAIIEDVIQGDDDRLLVLLSGRRYLQNAGVLGGSRLFLSDLSEWTPEDLEEEFVSLLDGRAVFLKDFAEGARGGGPESAERL